MRMKSSSNALMRKIRNINGLDGKLECRRRTLRYFLGQLEQEKKKAKGGRLRAVTAVHDQTWVPHVVRKSRDEVRVSIDHAFKIRGSNERRIVDVCTETIQTSPKLPILHKNYSYGFGARMPILLVSGDQSQ
ncbi:hypothetical protein CDL15_Pgr012319 [Punica granatum]|uniref:Uncharacterized protein n=1 Tax=Punica granatum TaxID=22663 RepID=A0A218VVT4_PUNGR|nr:hypothetical protein CDL15_Pgr012319 [Punica granatum]PKI66312.1 hypothetical protein CRG98_013274 [Punica granatum]